MNKKLLLINFTIIALFVGSTVSGSTALSTTDMNNSGQANIMQLNMDNIGSELRSSMDNVPATWGVQFSMADVVILYDGTDNITKAAAFYFKEFINDLTIDTFSVNSIDDLSVALSQTKEFQIVIPVFHGLPDSFRIGDNYYSWGLLDKLMRESPSNHFTLAACFSSILNSKDNGYYVTGLMSFLDYKIAVPLLTISIAQYIYDIASVERYDLIDKVQRFLNDKTQNISLMLLNPQNPLSGEKRTLEYTPFDIFKYESQFNTAIDKMDAMIDMINTVIEWIKNKMASFINNTINPVLESLPDPIFSSIKSKIRTELNKLFSFDFNLKSASDTLKDILSDDNINSRAEAYLGKKHLNTSIGVFTPFLKIVTHKFLDRRTAINFRGKVLQFGFEYESEEFTKTITVGSVPVTIKFQITGTLYNEILLKYEAHDPNFTSTDQEPINPATVIFNDDGSLGALQAYASVPGPFHDIVFESWFGSTGLNIPPWFRTYGELVMSLEAYIGIDGEKIMSKISHGSSKIAKFANKILDFINDADLTFGRSEVHAIFSLKGDNILITIKGVLSLGIDTEFKIGLLSSLNFSFKVNIWVSMIMDAQFTWDSEAIFMNHARVYYPRIDIYNLEAHLNGEIRVHIGFTDVVFKFNIDVDLINLFPTNPYYFPNGNLVDIGEDANIALNKDWTRNEAKNDKFGFYLYLPIKDFLFTVLSNMQPVLFTSLTGLKIFKDLFFTDTYKIRLGTIADSIPPWAAFLTKNSVSDPLFEGNTDAALNIITTDNRSIDVLNLGSINASLLQNGGASIEAKYTDVIPLIGDSAAVEIVAYDNHNADNQNSIVSSVSVKATFPKIEADLSFPVFNRVFTSSGGTFTMLKRDANMRFYIELHALNRIYTISDLNGNVIFKTPFSYNSTYSFSGWIPWAETSGISITVEDFDPPMWFCIDTCDGSGPDFTFAHDGELTFSFGEVQFIPTWDINTENAIDISSPDGALILDQSRSDPKGIGVGLGPFSGQDGWIAYYTLEMPLHRFYTQGVIPVEGWVTLTLTVQDNSSLEYTVDKDYYYKIPTDELAPDISVLSTNIQDATTEPSPVIASRLTSTYKLHYEDPVETVEYTFSHGTGHSSYEIQTGLNISESDEVMLYTLRSHVIKTVSSSTSNGFNFPVNRYIASDSAVFSMDIKMTGGYDIYLQIEDNKGITYLTYQSGYTGKPYDNGNGYLIFPGAPYNLTTGEWQRFVVDMQNDIKRIYPDGVITRFVNVKFRGSALIDNIMLDGEILMDGEDGSNSWTIYDNTPAGASVTNIIVDKLEQVNKPMTWALDTQNIVNDKLLSRDYTLTLDTTLYQDGTYLLQTSTFDIAGHGTDRSFWITIDNTAPNSATFNDIRPSSVTFDTNLNKMYVYYFKLNAGSDNIGIKEYKIYKDNVYQFTLSGGTLDRYFSVYGESGIVGYWTIKTIDYAGNSVTSASFHVDNDYDNDGLTDISELLSTGNTKSSPTDSDTDNDGLNDYTEVNTYHTYPNDSDSDNDGLNDYVEIKTYGTDPLDTDTDNDGLNDYVEIVTYNTDPLDSDSDNDSLMDGTEVNGWTVVINNGDNLETTTYRYTSNPLDYDTDNDGLSDGTEASIKTNPKSSDTDNDGMNDKWENTYGLNPTDYGDKYTDLDNDGLTNYAEYTYGTYPNDSDYDNDGLPDGWEHTYGLNMKSASGSDGASGDPDGDLISNIVEYQYNLNPKSYNTVFTKSSSSINLSSNYASFSISSSNILSGYLYVYLYKTTSSTGTSGTLIKTWTFSQSAGSHSVSSGYTVSSSGYYRFKIVFKASSTTYYSGWLSGYLYYQSSGGIIFY